MADESAELPISITLNEDLPDEQGNPVYYLTIEAKDWEMNIRITEAELKLLPNVREARWGNRTCLKIGTCAGVQTFWSFEEDGLSILVGITDEPWDFGVLLPQLELDNIIAEIESNK